MKKFLTLILTLFLLFAFCFNLAGCKAEDEEYLAKSITVFSWEDYIDLGDEEITDRYNVLDKFEEKTGIHVNYVTFANSEEMYNELEKNPNACDLLCPSEYMIMKMMTEGKLRSFDTPENYRKNCSQYIKDVFKGLGIKENGELKTPILSQDEKTTYAVGYMWGTMGFVYDMDRYSEDELNNWRVADEDRFYDKVTVKDSVRDTYIMAVGAVYQDELYDLKSQREQGALSQEEYNKKLTEIFNRCDEETVNKVEDYLIELRNNLYYFEVDNAKTDILKGRIDLYFAWSGDAVYAMDTGDEIDTTLGYVVPEEGSNIWFDGFVMPKNVSDSRAEMVIEFLNFICTPEIAVRNMEYIGYVSVIAGGDEEQSFDLWYDAYDEEDNRLPDEKVTYTSIIDWVEQNYCYAEGDEGYGDSENAVDLSYFFGDDTIVYSIEHGRQLYGLYSDSETISRCVIMDNFNDEALTRVNKMWTNVKFIQLSIGAIITIIILIVVLLALIVVLKKYRSNIVYWINDKIIYRVKKTDTIVKAELKKEE